MHAMRFSNARYFERRTSGPTGYPTPKFFFSRRNARRHLHIDVLRRAVLNVFFTTESRLYAYQYIFTPGSKLTCFTKSLAPYTANFSQEGLACTFPCDSLCFFKPRAVSLLPNGVCDCCAILQNIRHVTKTQDVYVSTMDAGARKLLLRVCVITAVTLLILSGYVSFSDSFCPWITDLCGSGDAGCRYQFCRNLLAHPAGAAAEGGRTFLSSFVIFMFIFNELCQTN